MTDKVAWGVLSTANIGTSKVIPGMQKGTLTRIDAIASRDRARAQRVAGELGIAKAYGSYEALLADPDIEAVYIPLPNHLHVPWSVRALDAGKHVLCEKPVALSAEQARLLVAARERSGKLVAEAFMVRHHPQWQRARELAQSGRIGEVRAIQTFFSYFLTDATNVRNQADIGGGGLLDIGCYAIATARYIFGAEPQRVAGLLERDPVLRVDRLSSALMEFPGNRHLTFTCSTQATPVQRVVVVGTKARIEVPVPFNQSPELPAEIVMDDGRDLLGGGAVTEAFALCDQYTAQGDRFSRAIRGEAAWEFPIEDAILNMRVIDAVFRAAERGTWEKP